MGRNPTIHVNPSLPHQVEMGHALAQGFRRHGLKPVLTPDPQEPGDWHVCNGPWFAKSHWPECLYIDRAYWGDPISVSIHWLKGGEKARFKGMPERPHPELKPMKTGDRTVFLCDFKGVPFGRYHTVRYHPSERKSRHTLEECIDLHDRAIGRRTTALVTAHIEGLQVQTDDPHSPVYGITDRVQWARDLAWHNWSIQEIQSGDAWEALKY